MRFLLENLTMNKLTFYRQQRFDGGVRNGVDFNGVSLLESFDSGTGDVEDPALEWFIDIRFRGNNLPHEPEAAREWLVSVGDVVRTTLELVADRLQIGLDDHAMPDETVAPDMIPGAELRIVVSCTNRATGQNIAHSIRDLRENWQQYLAQLQDESTVKQV
jgi:hypothetical protein